MRSSICVLALLCGLSSSSQSWTNSPEHDRSAALQHPASVAVDLPARSPRAQSRTDTLRWGYYSIINGQSYAVAGETWTWDHGAADPLEGWVSWDLSAEPAALFRQLTASSWTGHGNSVECPILGGAASVWVGRFEDEADSLCWAGGLGYGNGSCQRLVGPELVYGGGGTVDLDFLYFNDTEPDFDYTKVLLVS